MVWYNQTIKTNKENKTILEFAVLNDIWVLKSKFIDNISYLPRGTLELVLGVSVSCPCPKSPPPTKFPKIFHFRAVLGNCSKFFRFRAIFGDFCLFVPLTQFLTLENPAAWHVSGPLKYWPPARVVLLRINDFNHTKRLHFFTNNQARPYNQHVWPMLDPSAIIS